MYIPPCTHFNNNGLIFVLVPNKNYDLPNFGFILMIKIHFDSLPSNHIQTHETRALTCEIFVECTV